MAARAGWENCIRRIPHSFTRLWRHGSPPSSGVSLVKDVVLSQVTRVALWQWPVHRVLWGKQLPKGQSFSVVAEDEDGALTCCLSGDQYFVLWRDDEGKYKAGATTHK